MWKHLIRFEVTLNHFFTETCGYYIMVLFVMYNEPFSYNLQPHVLITSKICNRKPISNAFTTNSFRIYL